MEKSLWRCSPCSGTLPSTRLNAVFSNRQSQTTACVSQHSFKRGCADRHMRGIQSASPFADASGPSWVARAGAMDAMPAWTLDQIAGLVFGGVMLAAVVSARQVDVVVAKAQRRQLGLCEECGGVFEPGTCQQANCPAKRGGQSKAG